MSASLFFEKFVRRVRSNAVERRRSGFFGFIQLDLLLRRESVSLFFDESGGSIFPDVALAQFCAIK